MAKCVSVKEETEATQEILTIQCFLAREIDFFIYIVAFNHIYWDVCNTSKQSSS